MASPEKGPANITESVRSGLEKRRHGITGWLLSRGFTLGAGGALGAAAYLAIAGGTAAVAITAPLTVAILGGASVVGASLFATGVVRGIFRGA
ncbi:MAG TPA: hypothetical protein VLF93_00775 [Candidatus Saccharimonadales bacterium]|nr:hypothetical protein [Candidatus Saccharimonadales bacterium]